MPSRLALTAAGRRLISLIPPPVAPCFWRSSFHTVSLAIDPSAAVLSLVPPLAMIGLAPANNRDPGVPTNSRVPIR